MGAGVSIEASEIRVSSRSGDYRVSIGRGLREDAMERVDVLIMDERLQHFRPTDGTPTVLVTAGESLKTLEACGQLMEGLRALGVNRTSTIGACGGGSVQDATTLTASLYMRGVPWRYLPSTAMSALDACVGGKSAINVGSFKNLAGNFFPPKSITVDLEILEGLPADSMVCGLAEAVKICFAKGAEAFETYLNIANSQDDLALSEPLVTHVLSQKAWFVTVDEFDQAERRLLNFGHTFGHALEAATAFKTPHGIAVAYGIIAASLHPQSGKSLLTQQLISYLAGLLGASTFSPSSFRDGIDWVQFGDAILADKKGSGAHIVLILPSQSGKLDIVSIPKSAEEIRVITSTMQSALELVGASR
jgi:3-dehydroquinate synthase